MEIVHIGDVIETLESPYEGGFISGVQFVVLEVMDDNTVLIMNTNGEIRDLCYPEEYKVVGKIYDKVNKFWNEVFEKKLSNRQTKDVDWVERHEGESLGEFLKRSIK